MGENRLPAPSAVSPASPCGKKPLPGQPPRARTLAAERHHPELVFPSDYTHGFGPPASSPHHQETGQSADLTPPTPRQREREVQAGLQKYPVVRPPGTPIRQKSEDNRRSEDLMSSSGMRGVHDDALPHASVPPLVVAKRRRLWD